MGTPDTAATLPDTPINHTKTSDRRPPTPDPDLRSSLSGIVQEIHGQMTRVGGSGRDRTRIKSSQRQELNWHLLSTSVTENVKQIKTV